MYSLAPSSEQSEQRAEELTSIKVLRSRHLSSRFTKEMSACSSFESLRLDAFLAAPQDTQNTFRATHVPDMPQRDVAAPSAWRCEKQQPPDDKNCRPQQAR